MASLPWEAGQNDFMVLDRSDAFKVQAGEAAGACLLRLFAEEERCTSQSDSWAQSVVMGDIADVLWFRALSLLTLKRTGRGECKHIVALNAFRPGQFMPMFTPGSSSTQIPEESALL